MSELAPTPVPDERPSPVIRGLRAMAFVRWLLLLAVAAVAASTWWTYVLHPEPTTAATDAYYCPMHPQIRAGAPGTCPICFMKLEPIPAERRAPDAKSSAMPVVASPAAPPQPSAAPPGLADVMLTVERRQSVGIAVTAVTLREAGRELRLPAVIEAPEGAVSEVRVRVSGFVERVAPVETGSRVRAGQALAYVYSPEIVRALEELVTAQKLAGGQPQLGDRVVEAARQRLVLLGVHDRDIDEMLARGRAERLVPVRAPADGVITARQIAVGTQATPDTMLFQITNLSRVWASATVTAEDVSAIARGTKGRFVSRAAGREYDVEASLVEPRLSSATRTAVVRFTAKNSDVSLLPGDIGEVTLALPSAPHVLVPRDAVVDVGTHQYVFVESSAGHFTPRVVQVGALIGEERAVTSGLEAGERVVSRGAFVLDSESRLQAAAAPHTHGAAP
jgi:Cu(I)/Ag(I) efflux system membrane fusion protein